MLDRILSSDLGGRVFVFVATCAAGGLWVAFQRWARNSRNEPFSRFAAERGFEFSANGAAAWTEAYTRLPILHRRRFWSLSSLARGTVRGVDCRLFEGQYDFSDFNLNTLAAFRNPGADFKAFARDFAETKPGEPAARWYVWGAGEWALFLRIVRIKSWGLPSGCSFVQPEPAAIGAFFDRAFELNAELGPVK